jgi:hypothetical protein
MASHHDSHTKTQMTIVLPSVNINLVEEVDNLRNHLFGSGFCQFRIFPVDKWQSSGRTVAEICLAG